LSDSWTFLILRESYFGARRFESFQRALGMPRSTLTLRLRSLTAQGLLRHASPRNSGGKFEYRLTTKGKDLYPVMLALMSFGDKWLTGHGEPQPLTLVHNDCKCACRAIVACSHCHEELKAKSVTYRPGPGAGFTATAEAKRNRRASDPSILDRGRPSSVARTLKLIGDRWSFMIIREAFFGVRRFDELQTRLGVAPNILADRLQRLVTNGIFEKRRYRELPERNEYLLSEKGLDLYAPLLAMLRWGDSWLSGGESPLLLTHKICGADFVPSVICSNCQGQLNAASMSYKLSYSFPKDGTPGKPNRPIV
jgi:DNA-binding HxlR family transcriptional regulator